MQGRNKKPSRHNQVPEVRHAQPESANIYQVPELGMHTQQGGNTRVRHEKPARVNIAGTRVKHAHPAGGGGDARVRHAQPARVNVPKC